MASLVLDLMRSTQEPSLIIKWGGMPASWRWRGRLYDLAMLHAQWTDDCGHDWYRVESEEGLVFLLGRSRDGWTATLWSGKTNEAAERELGCLS